MHDYCVEDQENCEKEFERALNLLSNSFAVVATAFYYRLISVLVQHHLLEEIADHKIQRWVSFVRWEWGLPLQFAEI
jgi:hypothetical protein